MNKVLFFSLVFLLGTIVFSPFQKVFPQTPKESKIETPKKEIKIETPKKEIKKEAKISKTSQGLIDAGKKYPEAMVCLSEMHPFLMQLASEHANYMARIGVQGHQGFDSRFQKVIQAGVGKTASEICAESWDWQVSESMYILGWEMFKCWSQSPGHWSVASKKHLYFGAAMSRGSNGVWYSCIIVAN